MTELLARPKADQPFLAPVQPGWQGFCCLFSLPWPFQLDYRRPCRADTVVEHMSSLAPFPPTLLDKSDLNLTVWLLLMWTGLGRQSSTCMASALSDGSPTLLAWSCQTQLNQCGLGGYRARVIKDVFVSQAASRQGGDIAPAQPKTWGEPKQTTVIASHMPS